MIKHSAGYWFLFALFVTGIMLLGADAAYAVGTAGPFTCVNGAAQGSLYISDPLVCPKTLSSHNMFSFLVCNMEQLSSNLMGNMFCGMILGLAPMVQAVLVLATIFFAFGFMIGVIPATAREFQLFLLKVACVWGFATQSDLLLGVAYSGLINGIRDGVFTVTTNYELLHTGGSDVTIFAQLDNFIGNMIKFATDYVGVDKNTANNGCQNALWAVMAVMAVAFPPIFFLAIALLFRVVVTFLRAIFAYIYSLVGIAFLLCLAPFFLSFYLFRQTRSFFEKWVGYLVSFALQVVILFAFLAFILSINNSDQYIDKNGNHYYDSGDILTVDLNGNGKYDTGIGTDITRIVMPVSQVKEGGSFRMPWDYCTICDFEVYYDAAGKEIVVPQSEYSKFLRTGKLRCVDHSKDNPANPDMDPVTKAVPIKLDVAASPNKDKINALIQYAGAGFMALIVLVYILESLLSYVGILAQTLSGGIGGATWAPQLGGNTQTRPGVEIPGEGMIRDFESGMDRGFTTNKVTTAGKATGRDSISRSVEGVRAGLSQMLGGTRRGYNYDAKGNAIVDPKKPPPMVGMRNSGMTNHFLDWLVDPNHLDSN